MEESFIELQNADKGVYSMKQKKLLSMFGVLIIMIGTVAVMTGCPQANGNKDNIADGLNIQPTGDADPALKGTEWHPVSFDNVHLSFAEKGNTVRMGSFESVYTVNGSTVSFDFSKSAQARSAITVDTVIKLEIAALNEDIAKGEALLKKEQDAAKKKEYEEAIESLKKYLEYLKNLSSEEKDEIAKKIEPDKKAAKALEPHAKFDGTFNTDKTELTIEKFPVIKDNLTVEVKEVVLKKK